ncbi:MAG: hypothetical protein PF481_04000 [Bacteroidales bacterium]|jgi:hypothetical protein|nr:hypothetical protein [Bacteroidales bacterium]
MENYQVTIQGDNIESCYLKPMVYASQNDSEVTLRIFVPVNDKWELDPKTPHMIKRNKKTAFVYVNLIEKKSKELISAIDLSVKLKNNFSDYQVSIVFGDPEEGGSTILREEDIEIEPPF